MKLIDKDTLVAEIYQLKKSHDNWSYMGKCFHRDYETLLSFLDTLEVKEVEEPNASDRGMAEETIKEVCEWLDDELCCYIKAQDFSIDHARLNKDLRKHLEDDIWTQRIMHSK